jgi:pyruvate dehydrogenase E1 component alpha subunit
LTRQFDAKAVALQRTGKIGTFASSLGQEAVGVGVASAMRPEDVLLPSYREHGAQFVRGVTMTESLLYWGGDERGSKFSAAPHDFPNCVPIGTQVCHAAGAARAFQLRKEARVAVCIVGDGATSKGDFYEGLNMAGVWHAPMVTVVNNNQWAISVPRTRQTVAQTLAQKAIAVGVPALQVDGNDVIAVRQAMDEALHKARNGDGPGLIEAITYRLGDHTTADDASRYRDSDTVKAQWAFEPLVRLRTYLVKRGWWDATQEELLLKHCTQTVAQAVEDYLAVPMPPTSAMFEHLYATLPEAIQAQLANAQRFAPEQGAHHG